MGVPGFFAWLLKQDKNNKILKRKLFASPHTLYFDANCLFHPQCFKILKAFPNELSVDKLESMMMERIINYIKFIIEYANPSDLVYIAVDGVAPLAKINQQRKRRYKSVEENEMKNNIYKKYSIPNNTAWSNIVITPGTNFMKNLSIQLLKFIKKYKLTHNIKIILSTSNTHGEGEHKIHQYLKQENNSSKTKVVYGLDADLIFLTMAAQLDKLYVFREAQAIDEKSSKKFLMVDIDLLKNGIFEDIESKTSKKLEIEHVINDYIMLGFFLGNDFLPNNL